MRFTVLICAVACAGCAESSPNDIALSPNTRDAVLDNVIASVVLRDVNKSVPYMRAERTPWYWAFDFASLTDVTVAKTLEQLIRSTAPATANDTLTAGARHSVYIALPQMFDDSALVSITYQYSWASDCSWYHSSSNHKYVFRRRGGIWRFIRDNENVIGDPAPPPPPGAPRVCYGRGGIH